MYYCPKCGNPVKSGDFCTNCGARINPSITDFATPASHPSADVQDRASESNKNLKSIRNTLIVVSVIIGTLLLSLIVILSFLFFSGSFSDNKKESASSQNNSHYESSPNKNKDAYIMPSYIGSKSTEAKAQLETLGLKVMEVYEYSDEVAEGYIIKQSMPVGKHFEIGDSLTLYISRGPKTCPYDYEQKLVVDVPSHSSYGTATLYEWRNDNWMELASYRASVASKGIGTTKEGVSITPKGTYKLGVVLSAHSIATNLATYSATKNTCVVDDVNSPYYNQIMEKKDIPSRTHYDNIGITLADDSTYATIYIEHNGSGLSSEDVIPGNGSAIGLRGQNGSLSPTYGDVDISANDMRDLLSRLNAAKAPVIQIEVS